MRSTRDTTVGLSPVARAVPRTPHARIRSRSSRPKGAGSVDGWRFMGKVCRLGVRNASPGNCRNCTSWRYGFHARVRSLQSPPFTLCGGAPPGAALRLLPRLRPLRRPRYNSAGKGEGVRASIDRRGRTARLGPSGGRSTPSPLLLRDGWVPGVAARGFVRERGFPLGLSYPQAIVDLTGGPTRYRVLDDDAGLHNRYSRTG